MKKYLLFALLVLIAGTAKADNDFVPEVKQLCNEADPFADIAVLEAPKTEAVKPVGTYKNWLGEECIDFGEDQKMYYNWNRELTYSGIPIFLSSFIIKSQKRAFRSARFAMDENWKSEIDNYTQFAPYLPVVGLKALGYQGRSSWDRLLVSAGMANATMAAIVNATKYSVAEMRPDNSQANSFPSGHTATAFVAASVLHKEYGLTRSPWFSVGGYAVAMGTGFMRVLNNRHWISDVVAGAGIGILSTEVGYFFGDLIYKNKGITRLELNEYTNPNHPSFFSIQLGLAMHKNTLRAEWDDGDEPSEFELGTSSVVGVEGAYFFNKYFGVGGMARVTTTPVKGLGLTGENKDAFYGLNNGFDIVEDGQIVHYPGLEDYGMPGIYNVNASNTNMIDASFDVGVYGNLPLSKRFSLGAKFLCGVRINGGFEYKASMGYRTQAKDINGNPIYTYNGTDVEPVYVFEYADGSTFLSNDMMQPGVSSEYNFHLDPDKYKSDEYSLSKVTGRSNFNYVFGLSLNYKYKENFAWRIFIDYDSSKNHYNWEFNTISRKMYDQMKAIYTEPAQQELLNELNSDDLGRQKAGFKSYFNLFTIGAGFTVNF